LKKVLHFLGLDDRVFLTILAVVYAAFVLFGKSVYYHSPEGAQWYDYEPVYRWLLRSAGLVKTGVPGTGSAIIEYDDLVVSFVLLYVGLWIGHGFVKFIKGLLPKRG